MRTAPMLYSKKQFDAGGKLKLKAIADCVESIIGAFFEEYGEQVDARARRVRSSLPLSLSLSLSHRCDLCTWLFALTASGLESLSR